MNDYRGPKAGPGDEPPDVVPRTGPPTGPTRSPESGPAAATGTGPLAPTVAEPGAEAAPEPDEQPTNEPAAEPAMTPARVPVWEEAAETPSVAETVAETISEPAAEPEIAPEIERAPEPAAEPAAQAAREPTEASPVATSAMPSEASPPMLSAPAPALVLSEPEPRSPWPGRLRRTALILASFAAGYAVLVFVLIIAYRWIDPPRSALMLTTRLTGEQVLYAPVPISRISSYLQRAVVTSEDARFCYHRGVDWGALYEAMNEARGGSTITMQTAKNLFLWPSRSYIRKAIEIPVAMTIDAFWPKRRILEVYLNIAEWGPGIFGAEAAAHYHFDKPASRLTLYEATLLAASLPNPIARDAGEPGRVTALLASRLRVRMAHSDAFVRCLGLRPIPRPEPRGTPRAEPNTPQKKALKPAAKAGPELNSWQTTTDPTVSPWKN